MLKTLYKILQARYEKRSSRTSSALASTQAGNPVWTPRRYDTFAREAYQRNIVAFRCVEMVSSAVASIPWTLSRRASNGQTEIVRDHPILTLLERPNPHQDRSEFLKELVGFYLIAGNSYIEAVSPRGKPPLELWIKRPDRMKVVPGPRGIAAYEWEASGQKVRWPVDQLTGDSQIRHIRTFNPLNDWYGMSPIEAAAYNIDQHNEADVWNMGLLKNSAAPSGALETDMALGPEELKRLREAWNQRNSGGENAGNVVFLTNGLKWRGLSFSPRDMLLIQSKSFSARFICLAFGVPPFLIGLPEGATFTNFGEARLALWDETVIPLAKHILQEFSNWLLPKFGDTSLSFSLDLDDMPALEIRRASKWRRVLNAVQAGVLTPNDARKELGYGTVDGGDVLMLPLNAQPVSVQEDTVIASEKLDQILRLLLQQRAMAWDSFLAGDLPLEIPNGQGLNDGKSAS